MEITSILTLESVNIFTDLSVTSNVHISCWNHYSIHISVFPTMSLPIEGAETMQQQAPPTPPLSIEDLNIGGEERTQQRAPPTPPSLVEHQSAGTESQT